MIVKMVLAYFVLLLPALWLVHRLTVPLTTVDPAVMARGHDDMTRYIEAWRVERTAGRSRV